MKSKWAQMGVLQKIASNENTFETAFNFFKAEKFKAKTSLNFDH